MVADPARPAPHQPRTPPRIAAVLLAAGRSSRMPDHKLLLPLGGRPIIAHSASTALASHVRPIVVVIGRDADNVRAALPAADSADLSSVVNPEFASGLSTSLRTGLAAIPSDVLGAFILLGDQPFLTADHLNALAEVAVRSGERIVAAAYNGRRGNPVYFPRAYFAELIAVSGDAGGRAVITRHADEVVLQELDDPIAGLDIDTVLDYARAQELWGERHPHPHP